MEITSIGYSPLPLDLARKRPASQGVGQFGDALANAIKEVNAQQGRADDLAIQLALGKDVELHDAVLAMEEAQMSFQYALQIRNKLIEAYQEVMRMQV
ncbi:MAG: flagellar hook-basal body complex protein FliE [Sphingomonadaceae bacterium]